MTTETQREKKIQIPDEIVLGEFTLTIHGLSDYEAESLSNTFRAKIQSEFQIANPLLSILYDLVIEEEDVWQGSRKSRNKAKLKRKKGGGIGAVIKQTGMSMIFALQIMSIDPDVVTKNYGRIIQVVGQVFQEEGHDISTEQVNMCKLDNTPPFRKERHSGKENGTKG